MIRRHWQIARCFHGVEAFLDSCFIKQCEFCMIFSTGLDYHTDAIVFQLHGCIGLTRRRVFNSMVVGIHSMLPCMMVGRWLCQRHINSVPLQCLSVWCSLHSLWMLPGQRARLDIYFFN